MPDKDTTPPDHTDLSDSELHMALLAWRNGDITMVELKKAIFAQPPVVADEELNKLLWYHFQDGCTAEDVEDAKAALLQREQRLVAEARIDEIKRPRKYSKSVVVPDGYNEGYWDAHNQVGKADEIRVLELEAELAQLRHNTNTGKEEEQS